MSLCGRCCLVVHYCLFVTVVVVSSAFLKAYGNGAEPTTTSGATLWWSLLSGNVSHGVFSDDEVFFNPFESAIRDDGTPDPVGTEPERSGTGSGSVLGSREPDLKSQPSGFKLRFLSKCAASDSATLQLWAADVGRATLGRRHARG